MMIKGGKVEIIRHHDILAIAFLDAEHILTGGSDGIIRRWRASDGCQVGPEINSGSMIRCIAASEAWIAADAVDGVKVWNAKTQERFVEIKECGAVAAIDISPDSSKVAIGSYGAAVTVRDIDGDGQHVLSGPWWSKVVIWQAIRFSPDGSRIATLGLGGGQASGNSILVFDTFDGKQLFQTEPSQDLRAFAWSRNSHQLFFVSNSESPTGSGRSFVTSCDVLTHRSTRNFEGEFNGVIKFWGHVDCGAGLSLATSLSGVSSFTVCCTRDTVAFWDTSADSGPESTLEYPLIGTILEYFESLRFFSLSPDGLYLAYCHVEHRGKVTILCLRHLLPPQYFLDEGPELSPAQSITEKDSCSQDDQNANLRLSSSISSRQLPLMRLSDAVFVPWIKGNFERVDEVLEEEIETSIKHAHHTLIHRTIHHAFANRAFIYARQQKWKEALENAEKSLECQLSAIGLIAKSVTLVGLERHAEAFATSDLALMQYGANESKLPLLIKYIVFCLAGRYDDAIAGVTCLMDLVTDTSVFLVQAHMYLERGNWYVQKKDYNEAVWSFERVHVSPVFQKSPELQAISLIFGWCFDGLGKAARDCLRDALSSAAESVIESVTSLQLNTKTTWRIKLLEWTGDHPESRLEKYRGPIPFYAAALSLDHLLVNKPLLEKWADAKLATDCSWEDTLSSGTELKVARFFIYQAICGALKKRERLCEAIKCFCKMEDEISAPTRWYREFKQWISIELQNKLHTVDGATRREAIELYSAALLLNPCFEPHLIARSNLLALAGKWDAALQDAEKLIALDPSSHMGHERQHTALLGAKCYDEAFDAYRTMFSKLSDSPDREIDPFKGQYISPSKIEETIHGIVEEVIRNSPTILIDTITGRMRDKSQQAAAFSKTEAFKELRASMTTKIDDARIKEAVKKYYQYVMLSHTWEYGGDPEPSFQLFERTTVYELPQTETNDKLQQFLLLARDAGYMWAWSDTCCIDQLNQVILQESLVSMFRWYHGSALTVIFLREGADELESLVASYWITRGWTYQEYVAAETIRFYTKGWKPYRGLPATSNHKVDQRIREEVESYATGRSSRALQPGLQDIREKLRVASTRKTSREEDAAYSLFGIFNVSMPVIYGEGGSAALGRLLAHLLAAAGDSSILAWTGKSGSFNSCFPADITVFEHSATTHLPAGLDHDNMESIVASLHSSLDQNLKTATQLLCNRLSELPVSSFAANRMKLPCIMFGLGPSVLIRKKTGNLVYRAKTVALGEVDIQTNENIRKLGPLYLIHPWLNSLLLDRELSHTSGTTKYALDLPDARDGEEIIISSEAEGPFQPFPHRYPPVMWPPSTPTRSPITDLSLYVFNHPNHPLFTSLEENLR